MTTVQAATMRCECGRQAHITATDSPWEFDMVCTCGDVRLLSWAHKDQPPTFTPADPPAAQLSLFDTRSPDVSS